MGEERKTVLIVEDDRAVLESTARYLRVVEEYDVTSMLYLGAQEVPSEKFDLAVVDGLEGEGVGVLGRIDAERKFLYTGDRDLLEEARDSGYEAYSKTKELVDILGERQ